MIDAEKAILLLKEEQVVAIPTETVYGLAGRIDSEIALRKIFEIKQRPLFDPLIVHVASIEQAKTLTSNWNELAQKLAENFWPGPLTMVLPKSDSVNPLITSGLNRVGIRCPNHPIALEILRKLNIPLAAPSANKFKMTSPTRPGHVIDEFDAQVEVVDGGESEVGIESTVIGIFENEVCIYRPGMITKEMLQVCLGESVKVHEQTSPVAPGQMEDHYQPKSPFYLIEEGQEAPTGAFEIKLGDKPEIAARQLYSKLREGSEKSPILFICLTKHFYNPGWAAILDRIIKASSK